MIFFSSEPGRKLKCQEEEEDEGLQEADISKSCGWIRTKLDGHGCMTRTNRFDFGEDPDPDLAYQWDTKCKLFSLAEVCALPSAVLVQTCAQCWFHTNTIQ